MTNPTPEELKPCPFCGYPAEYYDEEKEFAHCMNGDCPLWDHMPVYKWNTRPAETLRPLDEKELLHAYQSENNYDDEMPKEMWDKILQAAKCDDREFFTQMMKISVINTRIECAKVTVERFGQPVREEER